MAFCTRGLYQMFLFDSTGAFLAPRASAVGYLLRPLPSLTTTWSLPPSRLSPPRISRRLPVRPLPSLATSWSPPSSRFFAPAHQSPVTCAPYPLACHHLVAAAVALVAPAHQSPVTCAPAPLACHLLVAAAVALVAPAHQAPVTFCARSPRLPPLGCATVAFIALAPQLSVTFFAPLFSGTLLFFHFSSTKRKENRGAATQDTQVAIRIEQQATHNINPRITRTMRSKLKSRCRVL